MAGDKRAAGGSALSAICVVGAAAMGAAAAFLLEPSLVDLGVYVERGKHALAAYVLIYAALLVSVAVTAEMPKARSALGGLAVSLLLGPSALFALGILFAGLAGDALLFRDPANYWAGLFAVPSLLCFVAAGRADVKVQRPVSGDARSAFGEFLSIAAYITLFIAAIIVYFNLGYFLFYVLQANLLDGSDIDFVRFGEGLITIARAALLERGMVALVIGPICALLLMLFTRLMAAAEGPSSAPAEMAPADQDFVERCAGQVEAYAEARGYSRDARRLLWFVVLPSLLAPMLLVSIVGLNLHNWVPRPYDPAALAPLGWHVYERSAGASAIVMVFAGILWGVLPNAVLSRLSRGYAEIAGWAGFAANRMSLTDYLSRLFRAGRLSPERAFDPGQLLREINTRYEPYFLFPAVAFTFIAAIAWHHDMSRYHLLTERYAEVMDYWTLKRQRFAYSEVSGVELECSFDKDGWPVASYEIALPEGFSINVLKKQLFDRADDLARIDAKIGTATPRTFATIEPLFRPERSAYDPVCVEALAAGLEEAEGERFRAIFRVEEWHRARWVERTSPPK